MDCGPLQNAYGPYDYTNTTHRRENLPIVEKNHFNSDVEMLIKGQAGYLVEDLDYILRAFPNHHRALRSMMMLQLRDGRPGPTSRFRTIECYLDRASRMNPKDTEVLLIHASLLHKIGDLNGALDKYQAAEKLRPGLYAPRDYGIGLLYFDLKNYDRAYDYAKRAYSKKYPSEELRTKLESVGAWPKTP